MAVSYVLTHEAWMGNCKVFTDADASFAEKAMNDWLLERTKEARESYNESIKGGITDQQWLEICFEESWGMFVDNGYVPEGED